MVKLSFEKYGIMSADLGQNSCLPDIHVNSYIRAPITVSDKIQGKDGENIGKGMISTLLPYFIVDGYNRERKMRYFNSAILENEYLKAVFLPELGGRLWSLYDKKENRELLYKNDIFQPANLALTNAWFSGGVEWNVGIKGHNPLTCAPLFAQKTYNKKGEPVLKMYEFERIRGVAYSVEATLDKDELLIRGTIENTSPDDTYMYWWSNIAVPETPKTRVITPAENTFFCSYTDGGYFLDKKSMPFIDGKDVTYSSINNRSHDFFFDIKDDEDKWICAVDENGKGLLQRSDNTLIGRKLFVWGQHVGGRHWNEWLSDKAGAYVEIQAGLLKTQLEHFVMKGNTTITWQESYSSISVNPEVAHGEYFSAVKEVSKTIKKQIANADKDAFTITTQDKIEQYGSGWGALENIIRENKISNLCAFPTDSLGEEQSEWINLINDGVLPDKDVNAPIKSYVVGKKWLSLMQNVKERGWYYYNHLGIMQYADGDYKSAKESFIISTQKKPNAWAYRNLAMIEKNIELDVESASENILRAIELKNDYNPLVVECANLLLIAKKYALWISLYETLPKEVKSNGRVKMLLGACYSKIGDTQKATEIINRSLVVDDIKEGEYALSSIWLDIYTQVLAKELGKNTEQITPEQVFEKYPLPRELDFRMH